MGCEYHYNYNINQVSISENQLMPTKTIVKAKKNKPDPLELNNFR